MEVSIKLYSQHKIKLKRLPQIIYKHMIVKFYVRCCMQDAKRNTTHSERDLAEFGRMNELIITQGCVAFSMSEPY